MYAPASTFGFRVAVSVDGSLSNAVGWSTPSGGTCSQ
jgi:hypothetical protein